MKKLRNLRGNDFIMSKQMPWLSCFRPSLLCALLTLQSDLAARCQEIHQQLLLLYTFCCLLVAEGSGKRLCSVCRVCWDGALPLPCDSMRSCLLDSKRHRLAESLPLLTSNHAHSCGIVPIKSKTHRANVGELWGLLCSPVIFVMARNIQLDSFQ